MKKIFLFAAATAVALSSCSKNEVTTTSADNNAIGFGLYTGVATKGTVASTSTIQATDKGFGVFGYYDSSTTGGADGAFAEDSSTPNFMFNTHVTCTSGAWSYSPMKYWPNNTRDVLSFFAYAPYSDNSSATNGITFEANSDITGVPVLTYRLNETASAMVDMVVAAPDYNNTNTTTSATDQADVEFVLKHVLTRATFNAVVNVTDDKSLASNPTTTAIYVKSMKIVGATSSACVDKTNNTTTSYSTGFHNSADFTYMAFDATASEEDVNGVGSWSNDTTTGADYDLASVLNLADLQNKTGYSSSTKTDYGVAVTETSATLFAGTGDDAEYLFLIPADGDTGINLTDKNVFVYIEYDVVTTDTSLKDGYSKVTNKDIITLPAETLKAGKAYVYNLTIGLDEVNVSATVENTWATESTESLVTPEA